MQPQFMLGKIISDIAAHCNMPKFEWNSHQSFYYYFNLIARGVLSAT